jgi:chromosome partitioning protein
LATHVEGIDIVPANQHLEQFNVPKPTGSGMQQFCLSELLESTHSYDIIMIDCPPNLYQCSWNGLLASDAVVIPVVADDFGVQGLRAVHEAIKQAQQIKPSLTLLGQFLTKFDRRVGIHREFESALRRVYGDQMFSTVIQEAAAFKLAVSARKPVSHYSSWSRATRQTKSLALEMIDRIEKLSTNRKVA